MKKTPTYSIYIKWSLHNLASPSNPLEAFNKSISCFLSHAPFYSNPLFSVCAALLLRLIYQVSSFGEEFLTCRFAASPRLRVKRLMAFFVTQTWERACLLLFWRGRPELCNSFSSAVKNTWGVSRIIEAVLSWTLQCIRRQGLLLGKQLLSFFMDSNDCISPFFFRAEEGKREIKSLEKQLRDVKKEMEVELQVRSLSAKHCARGEES